MVKYKYIDWICIGAAVLAILLTLLLMFGEQLGLPKASANPGYVTRLFDDSRVHVIDIQIADWGVFIEDAEQEEYVACTVEIDGEAFHNIGLRAKGNNSLRLTEEYGLSRYSLKLEFDQFLDGGNYYIRPVPGRRELLWAGQIFPGRFLSGQQLPENLHGLRYDGVHGGACAPLQLCLGDGQRRGLGLVPGGRGAGGSLCPPEFRE